MPTTSRSQHGHTSSAKPVAVDAFPVLFYRVKRTAAGVFFWAYRAWGVCAPLYLPDGQRARFAIEFARVVLGPAAGVSTCLQFVHAHRELFSGPVGTHADLSVAEVNDWLERYVSPEFAL